MAAPLLEHQRVPMPWPDYLELGDDVPGEYYGGCLVMSPSPDQQHQLLCRRLANSLEQQVSDAYTVNTAWQWAPSDGQNYIPDVMVYEATTATARLRDTPVLAVEVLSGNRSSDLVVKASGYAKAGLPNYWVIDRTTRTVDVFILADGIYVTSQVITADQPAEVELGIATVHIDLGGLLG